MRRRAVWCVAVVLVCAAACARAELSLLPLPQYVEDRTAESDMCPDWFFETDENISATARAALDRYHLVMRTKYVYKSIRFQSVAKRDAPTHAHAREDCVSSIRVRIAHDTAEQYPIPQLHADESYTIDIHGTDASLDAETVWGVVRGAETLAQLTHYREGRDVFVLHNARVEDAPRFPWRGLLVDTARHYLPLPLLHTIVDSMATVKLNTLHWHIVDAESFPFESHVYPQLSGAGAYHDGAVYTHDDIRELIAYAAMRGVRVVPEFDIPAHCDAWSFGIPDLITACPEYVATKPPEGFLPFDVTRDSTYEVLSAVLREAAALFPDKYMHIGGDEVFPWAQGKLPKEEKFNPCWRENADVNAFMAAHGLEHHYELYAYFASRMYPMFADVDGGVGKNVVQWEEAFEFFNTTMPRNATVEVWKSAAELFDVVDAGFDALFSFGWYMDVQIPDKHNTHYFWQDTWQNFWWNEPVNNATGHWREEHVRHVLGGEGAIWGEQVDEANWMARVWPRVMAIAERLWSPHNPAAVPHNTAALPAAVQRISHHRCRLKAREFDVGPMQPGFCKRLSLSCPAPLIHCNGECVDTAWDHRYCGGCQNRPCGGGQRCTHSQCEMTCPELLTKCDNSCFDLLHNPKHCGACGHACGIGEYCDEGTCGGGGGGGMSTRTAVGVGAAAAFGGVLVLGVAAFIRRRGRARRKESYQGMTM